MNDAAANSRAASENRMSLSEDKINSLKRLAARAAVAVACILIVAKAGAWILTGSVSLLSTLIDSLLDALASTVNLLAIRHAAQPADKEHRFGHGKAEPLAGLAQAAFVSGSAAFLVFQAMERLFHPVRIEHSNAGIAVMVFSMAMTLGLVLFQRFVVNRTNSVAISADALHYRSDLLVNTAVIVALVLSAHFGLNIADPVLALMVAVYILVSAKDIFLSSYHMLMDRELPDEDRDRIRAIALRNPQVISVHDLRTRSAGTRSFIQFHLELNGDLKLREAHAIADAVMASIEEAFPSADVLIHEDPHGVPERRAAFE